MSKHRVPFEAALPVFLDPNFLLIDTARTADGESRQKVVGTVNGRLFTVVFVMRGEICRLISARRSNAEEERIYGTG